MQTNFSSVCLNVTDFKVWVCLQSLCDLKSKHFNGWISQSTHNSIIMIHGQAALEKGSKAQSSPLFDKDIYKTMFLAFQRTITEVYQLNHIAHHSMKHTFNRRMFTSISRKAGFSRYLSFSTIQRSKNIGVKKANVFFNTPSWLK